MKQIPRDLFDIAEDFDLEVISEDKSIGLFGSFQNFTGFMVDLSIQLHILGQAQLAFDLAKAVEYDFEPSGNEVEFFDFVGFQFQ